MPKKQGGFNIIGDTSDLKMFNQVAEDIKKGAIKVIGSFGDKEIDDIFDGLMGSPRKTKKTK